MNLIEIFQIYIILPLKTNKMRSLHKWKLSASEAIEIQNNLRNKITLKKSFSKIETIGGADVSYFEDRGILVGVITVYSYPEMNFIEYVSARGKVTFPYIPGLLSFREGPILIKAFKKLKIRPELVLFDGQGIAHPRGIGLASHLGIWLDIPTIGCAKTPLLKIFKYPGLKRGEFEIILKDDQEVCAVLRTKDNTNPIFVSPGHKIDLTSSIRIVLTSCKGFRIPEPLRKAHQISKLNERNPKL